MKHKRALPPRCWRRRSVLAGCGGAKERLRLRCRPPEHRHAAPEHRQQHRMPPALTAHKRNASRMQFTLEKTFRLYEWGSALKLTIHVPQLVCDFAPDAAYLNR
ncbi:MAG: hypothetical protein ACLVJH_06945 [Faecalibacterium prausnitzii]